MGNDESSMLPEKPDNDNDIETVSAQDSSFRRNTRKPFLHNIVWNDGVGTLILQYETMLERPWTLKLAELSIVGRFERSSGKLRIDAPELGSGTALAGIGLPSLRDQIIPYIESLIAIQHVFDEIQGQELSDIRIYAIRYGSINIDLSVGIRETADLCLDYIVPWRRKNKKRLAQLDISEREIAIDKQQVELNKAKLELARFSNEADADNKQKQTEAEKLKAEAELILAQARQQQLANQKQELELIKLAVEMVKSVAPELPEEKQILYATKLLKPARELATSPLEIVRFESTKSTF